MAALVNLIINRLLPNKQGIFSLAEDLQNRRKDSGLSI